jgi:hypothetical protein
MVFDTTCDVRHSLQVLEHTPTIKEGLLYMASSPHILQKKEMKDVRFLAQDYTAAKSRVAKSQKL